MIYVYNKGCTTLFCNIDHGMCALYDDFSYVTS